MLTTEQEKSQMLGKQKAIKLRAPEAFAIWILHWGWSIEHREDLIIFIVGPWNVRLFFQNKMDFRVLEKILDHRQRPTLRGKAHE